MYKEKSCAGCRFYKRYYIKAEEGEERFNMTDLGWCRRNQEIFNADDYCNKFIEKPKSYKDTRFISIYIDDLLEQKRKDEKED